jgi:hypothetical protein
MFRLQNQQVRIVNFNPRAEKHGEDNKLAGDLKVEVTLPNSVLDEFDKGLRQAIYRKPAKGEQQDLIDPASLTSVQFPKIGALKWDEEFPGYDLEVFSGLGLSEPLILVDCTVRKFAFQPLEGGSVGVTFSVICHPDPAEAGQLCALIQSEADVTLTPPAKQELANAA